MDNTIKFPGDKSNDDLFWGYGEGAYMNTPLSGGLSEDTISFESPWRLSDPVNSPSHYTRGSQEAIDIIEEAIQDAPDVKSGMLQAQVLKYLLRLWLKDNPEQDAKKAQWYLNRLVDSLN